jgi:hypothetical protein
VVETTVPDTDATPDDTAEAASDEIYSPGR